MTWARGVGLAGSLVACTSSAPPPAQSAHLTPVPSSPSSAPSASSTGPSAAPASSAPPPVAAEQPRSAGEPSAIAAEPAPPLAPAYAGAEYASALQNNPFLLQALLGEKSSDPRATFDHPKGTPLAGQCALESIAWRETPSLYGLEGFTQVKNEAEALALGKRSYTHLKQKLLDLDKKQQRKKGAQQPHPGADLAAISVMHYAPGDDGVLLGWGEVYLFVVDRECAVSPLLMLHTGSKPVNAKVR